MIKIPEENIYKVCKLGLGAECCRYMIVDPDIGISCAKNNPSWKKVLDGNIDNMVARSDNCEGLIG